MPEQRSWFHIVRWKLVVSVVLGAGLWVGSGALGFPLVFQIMFAFYAFLGFVVFVMLDLPPMKEITGGKALIALVIFYLACSALYVAASSFLPQYDPAWEKDKIAKILERKREKSMSISNQELYARTMELMEKADTLMIRLEQLEGGEVPAIDLQAILAKRRKPGEKLSPEEMVAYGQEVYDLYECYNCHKVGGKGAVKKRGPKLDNIGNLVKAEDLKTKILDPMSFVAEGFEKEHEKGLMPDNYKEIMDDLELDSLVAYLVTLKNTRVDTPKPIFHDH